MGGNGQKSRRGVRVPLRTSYVGFDARRSPSLRGRTDAEARNGASTVKEAGPFGPIEFLQMASIGRRSVRIEVGAGQVLGVIVVHEGAVWAAWDALGLGEPAFQRLVSLPGAIAHARPLEREPGERTIFTAWEQLVFDIARAADEGLQSGVRTPDCSEPSAPPARPPAPTLPSAREVTVDALVQAACDKTADSFDAVFEAGIAAVLVRQYRAAYAAFEKARAIRPDDPTVAANLERLRQLGYGRA